MSYDFREQSYPVSRTSGHRWGRRPSGSVPSLATDSGQEDFVCGSPMVPIVYRYVSLIDRTCKLSSDRGAGGCILKNLNSDYYVFK